MRAREKKTQSPLDKGGFRMMKRHRIQVIYIKWLMYKENELSYSNAFKWFMFMAHVMKQVHNKIQSFGTSRLSF